MESEQKDLAHLPAVAYSEGLLPLLSVNEVLRLRRVCKPLKVICDDHLRKKCPSRSIVRLREREEDDWFCDNSLSQFLKFDSTSSIKIPSQHFHLDYNYGKGIGQLSLNLSTRYGTQIKHLSMDKMNLPFVSNSAQFHFFQNLTNLSSLTLGEIVIVEQNDANDADPKIEPESLPASFKNSIRKFAVSKLSLERESDADKFWETVGLFEKLECFQFPKYYIRHRTAGSTCRILEHCCKLIERESSNMKCFDLQNLEGEFGSPQRSEESLRSFSEQSLRNQIKWENVAAWILEESSYQTVLRSNAELIVSMSYFSSKDAKGLSFPNLVSLDANYISYDLPTLPETEPDEWLPDWSKIPQILSPSKYPALRILRVTAMGDEDNQYFCKAWQYLTNLEEVAFKLTDQHIKLSNKAFLGDKQTREPPFLQLIRLRKLSFHILPWNTATHRSGHRPRYSSICDAFHQAFRLMPLKEFNITSQFPVPRHICDKDAILALCSPGPFIENIEKFSFRSWSMAGVKDDEFRQLGRMFPNNQAM